MPDVGADRQDRGKPDGGRSIPVPELRDYQQINAELVRLLDLGTRRIRLEGVEGQRLLVAGIQGPWNAVIEVDGNAGPELAAAVDAPGLTVICRGSSLDGAGRGLVRGTLLLVGATGVAVGYAQRGGRIVAGDVAAARAGLGMMGGDLFLLSRVGPLAGERQAAGRIFHLRDGLPPHLGHGARGGRRVPIEVGPAGPYVVEDQDRLVFDDAVHTLERIKGELGVD